MKRNFNLFVVVLVVMVLTFASCGNSHEHEYSTDWSSDATNHWHAALCDDAEPADLAAHTLVEGVCSVCGYNANASACSHETCTSEVVKASTCTEKGEEKFTCSDCGYSFSKELDLVEHTVEIIPSVEPTCTQAGLSRGKKCSVCGSIIEAQKEIASIPHEFVDGVCSFGCGTAEGTENSGDGTETNPYILTSLGDYTTPAVEGTFYKYVMPYNGYITLTSDYSRSEVIDGEVYTYGAMLKLGSDIYAMVDNGTGTSVTIFATKGTAVYVLVGDQMGSEEKIPFTISVEKVDLGSIDAFVGSWKLVVKEWCGDTTYIFNIDEDGNGTVVQKAGQSEIDRYSLSAVVVENVAYVTLINSEDESLTLNITYDSSNSYTVDGGISGINGQLLPYDSASDDNNPNVSYDTVIVKGENTLYFSADEIDANTADRTLSVTGAGDYEFASGNLFVSKVTDANGNVVAKNDDYSYTLTVGDYTLTFGMFSAFGVSADAACSLNFREIVSDDGEGDEDETYTEPYNTFKDSLEGEYKFDNYSVLMVYNGYTATYYANVYLYDADKNLIYDLYFTYETTENANGSYTLTLTYASRPDIEVGTEYIDTVLGYNIVIVPQSV